MPDVNAGHKMAEFPAMPSTVMSLYNRGLIRPLDYQFARFLHQHLQMQKQGTVHDELVIILATLVSYQLGKGHSCVNLAKLPFPLFECFSDKGKVADKKMQEGDTPLQGFELPELEELIKVLQQSSLVTLDERPAPLRLNGQRLYLYRYWIYEKEVGEKIGLLLENKPGPINFISSCESDGDTVQAREALASSREAFRRLFPNDDDNPWPSLAAALALKNKLTIISGGPGTGKTTTVTRTLTLLIEAAARKNQSLLIQLAAPTGKAAARLSESIINARQNISAEAEVLAQLPNFATTLHRLLGVIPGRYQYRHHAGNPLHLDILLVDEASMIDLPMMHALLDALPPHAALILLGDKDQLASVAPGSVLADLCKGSERSKLSVNTSDYVEALTGFTPGTDGLLPDNSMANSLCLLRKSYRFDEFSPIGIAAREINAGNYKGLQNFWCDDSEPKADQGDLCFYPSGSKYSKVVMQDIVGHYRDFVKTCQQDGGEKAAELLEKFTDFQVLCATRDGPQSVEFINQMVESALFKQGVIPIDGWYAGCPVMITENNYGQRLFNGDIGIVLRDIGETEGLKVFFPADLTEGDVRPRVFSTRRLPAFSKVFAMTVHKSQGSEFDEIVFVLPDRDSSVLTRELVYTGVTRAKRVCRILVNKGVLRDAVKKRVLRDSGLKFS